MDNDNVLDLNEVPMIYSYKIETSGRIRTMYLDAIQHQQALESYNNDDIVIFIGITWNSSITRTLRIPIEHIISLETLKMKHWRR